MTIRTRHTPIRAGMRVETPRFCTVEVEKLYTSESEAKRDGYTVSTDYQYGYIVVEGVHNVLGHQIDMYHMTFCAVVAADVMPE